MVSASATRSSPSFRGFSTIILMKGLMEASSVSLSLELTVSMGRIWIQNLRGMGERSLSNLMHFSGVRSVMRMAMAPTGGMSAERVSAVNCSDLSCSRAFCSCSSVTLPVGFRVVEFFLQHREVVEVGEAGIDGCLRSRDGLDFAFVSCHDGTSPNPSQGGELLYNRGEDCFS